MKSVKLGIYEITNEGKVYNSKRNKELKYELTNNGYHRVTLCFNGVTIRYLLHRLIATLFIENKKDKPQINHINGNKIDNRVENLEWVTAQENAYKAYHGDYTKTKMSNEIRKKPVLLDNQKGHIIRFDSMSEASKHILKELERNTDRKNTKNMTSQLIRSIKKGINVYGYKCYRV